MVPALKMEIILEFVKSFSSKAAMIDWFTKYCSPELVVVAGDDTLTFDTFIRSLIALIESSPNPVIDVFDIYKLSNGVVYLNCQISGKHTEKPFSYLDYTPIPSSGCAWKNDPEILIFTPQEDNSGAVKVPKIGKITVLADEKAEESVKNGFVGPKGVYQQISISSNSPA